MQLKDKFIYFIDYIEYFVLRDSLSGDISTVVVFLELRWSEILYLQSLVFAEYRQVLLEPFLQQGNGNSET